MVLRISRVGFFHYHSSNRWKTKLALTCLFLSSVIRWIWIFFLPMMLYREKRWSYSSREVCHKGWERKLSLLPRSSAQKYSGKVIHPRTNARTHFSGQMWQFCNSFYWQEVAVKNEWCRKCGAERVDVFSSLLLHQGEAWQTSM